MKYVNLLSISELREITDVWHRQEITTSKCRDMLIDKVLANHREWTINTLTEELDNCGLYEDDKVICTLIMPTKRIEEIADKIHKINKKG